jgi:hypothetical protein
MSTQRLANLITGAVWLSSAVGLVAVLWRAAFPFTGA